MNRVFLFLIFFFLLLNLNAQTCCSGGVPVSGNIGFQSSEAKILQLSVGGDFNFLNTLFSERTKSDDDLRKRRTQSLLIRSAYSFTKRFSVETLIPLVRQTRRITTNQGGEDVESSLGIGDPLILFNYDLLKKPFNLRVGVGPQIPLGAYNKKNDRGILLVEDLQPGSGAWDFIFFSSIEKRLKSRPTGLAYFNSIYSMNGVNDDSRGGNQTYKFGNDVQLILGYSDQMLLLSKIITPGLALRYRRANRDEIDGIVSSGTGGQWLFLKMTGGMKFLNENSFTLNVEVPLFTHVNDTQLSSDLIVNVSWSKRFDFSKKINHRKNEKF